MGGGTAGVFVSYSHDSAGHEGRVLALADRLRSDGVDCVLDQYEPAPAEGWPRWMERRIAASRFVLLICTDVYLRRVEGRERPGTGLGVAWESNLLYNLLYAAGTLDERLIPVLLDAADVGHIPLPLRGLARYVVADDAGYEALYRRLTDQPISPGPALGEVRRLAPAPRAALGLPRAAAEAATGLQVDLGLLALDPLSSAQSIPSLEVRVRNGTPGPVSVASLALAVGPPGERRAVGLRNDADDLVLAMCNPRSDAPIPAGRMQVYRYRLSTLHRLLGDRAPEEPIGDLVATLEAGGSRAVRLPPGVRAALEGCAMAERRPVRSSNLREVGYDPATRTLEVTFHNGGVYHYYDVPAHLYRGLAGAASAGSFLHARIKSTFGYRRVR